MLAFVIPDRLRATDGARSRRRRAASALRIGRALGALAVVGPAAASARAEPPPITVYILAGQSNMEGHGQVESLGCLDETPDGRALLATLRDEHGAWRTIPEVTVAWAARDPSFGPLRPGWGMSEREVGPELGFGAVMAQRHDGPVLLVKTAWGGKDVFCDFRAPSAGPPEGDEAALLAKEAARGDAREVGACYRRMIEEIRATLARIPEIVPGSQEGQAVELAGFAWFQGWNDFCRWHERDDGDRRLGRGIIAAYPRNLAAIIRDLRRDLDAPGLPVVIGELGVGGTEIAARAARESADGEAAAMVAFREAQRATLREPGMTRVGFVPTAQYWDDRLAELDRERDRWSGEKRRQGIPDRADNELPTPELTAEYRRRGGHWYCHYNGSAANYVRIGAALAEALPAKSARRISTDP